MARSYRNLEELRRTIANAGHSPRIENPAWNVKLFQFSFQLQQLSSRRPGPAAGPRMYQHTSISVQFLVRSGENWFPLRFPMCSQRIIGWQVPGLGWVGKTFPRNYNLQHFLLKGPEALRRPLAGKVST